MTVTTHEPDPDDAADDELARERAGQSATAEQVGNAASPPERTDDVTTLTNMNATPPSPDDTTAAAGERADTVAILDSAPEVEPHADDAKAVLKDVGQATGVRTPELDEATEPVRPTMIR
jgi:hypothetical protein